MSDVILKDKLFTSGVLLGLVAFALTSALFVFYAAVFGIPAVKHLMYNHITIVGLVVTAFTCVVHNAIYPRKKTVMDYTLAYVGVLAGEAVFLITLLGAS